MDHLPRGSAFLAAASAACLILLASAESSSASPERAIDKAVARVANPRSSCQNVTDRYLLATFGATGDEGRNRCYESERPLIRHGVKSTISSFSIRSIKGKRARIKVVSAVGDNRSTWVLVRGQTRWLLDWIFPKISAD